MNYKILNNCILQGQDLPSSFIKDDELYNYLLNNSIAFYYCTQLSKQKNSMEEKIIAAGNKLNNKYYKTLKLINKLCKKNKVEFLIFKTYKYVPEAVDNDIDLFVKQKDFLLFLKILETEGFNCWENESLKGICTKEGFCNIEPRVNAEFHELIILKELKIWEKTEPVTVDGIKVLKVVKEIDAMHLLLSILYNPNYLKLYVFTIIRGIDIEKLYALVEDERIKQDLKLLKQKLFSPNNKNNCFPLFMNSIDFALWWFRRMLPNSKLNYQQKFKHIIFFFYMKYSYRLFNKLVFKHRWNLG